LGSKFYGQGEVQDGILNFTWADVEGDGHDIDDGTRLFTLCFRAVADGTASIDFTSNPTPMEVFRFIDSSTEEQVTEFSFIPGTIAITGCNMNPGDGNGSTNLTLSATSNTATCSDPTVCINVLADNFTSLQDLQFSVNWDPSIMEFVSVMNNNAALDPTLGVVYGQTEIQDGILNFNWSDVEGDGHTLVNGMYQMGMGLLLLRIIIRQ